MQEDCSIKETRRHTLSISVRSFYLAALAYLTLPVVIFFFGYLKIWWAVLFSAGLIGAVYLTMRSMKKDPISLKESDRSIVIDPSFLIFVILLIPLLLYLGGVSEFGSCSADHRVRYAILNDLVEYKWPVIYDFSTQQNPTVAASLGSGTAAFAYYFVFWMIPALFGKLFGLMVARIVLFIWTGIGLFLVSLGASLLYKRSSKVLFFCLIIFAGFDVIPYAFNRITGTGTTWEGWTDHLYIHSNFFQIMNVFNQSIPGWMITLLLLLAPNGQSIGLLGGLMFCYSPWATIGILPMCVCKLIISSRKTNADNSEDTNGKTNGSDGKALSLKPLLRTLFTPQNIIPPIICLVLFGSLYTANPNATGADGFIWKFYTPLHLLKDYLMFVLFDFVFWFILIIRKHKKDPMLWTAFITLLILPVYKISIANDFLMRGSMAPMFMIGLYVVMFVTDNFEMCRGKNLPLKKAIAGRLVLILMVIAAYTPGNYLLYSALTSYPLHLTDESYVAEKDLIGSFGNIKYASELQTVKDQFFVYDYEDSVFFKYFAK
ncbi:MAG: hypothetical protein IKX68_01860 [Clostridiales bacterium]|nr:hypothetical protein [Clostridiales bacterium]